MDKFALNVGYAIILLGIALFLLNICAVWQSSLIYQIICLVLGNLLIFTAPKFRKANL